MLKLVSPAKQITPVRAGLRVRPGSAPQELFSEEVKQDASVALNQWEWLRRGGRERCGRTAGPLELPALPVFCGGILDGQYLSQKSYPITGANAKRGPTELAGEQCLR